MITGRKEQDRKTPNEECRAYLEDLELIFGFHVAFEDLCVLHGFLFIKLSQALGFPDRSCEGDTKKTVQRDGQEQLF